MIKTILAIIGVLAIFAWFIKTGARVAFRIEYGNGKIIWESRNIKGLFSEERNRVQGSSEDEPYNWASEYSDFWDVFQKGMNALKSN